MDLGCLRRHSAGSLRHAVSRSRITLLSRQEKSVAALDYQHKAY